MSNQTKLQLVEQPNDTRIALRSAIEQHRAALEQAARVTSAFTHAEETVFACIAKVSEAEAKLAETKSNEGERLAAIALGESIGISAANAEVDLTRLRNDLQTARRTRDALEQRAERERAEVERCARSVKEATVAVVRAELPVADRLAKAQDLQEQLIATRAALRQLWCSHCLADADLKGVESFLRSHDLPVVLEPEFVNFDGHPSAVAVREVLALLGTDASAPLPI